MESVESARELFTALILTFMTYWSYSLLRCRENSVTISVFSLTVLLKEFFHYMKTGSSLLPNNIIRVAYKNVGGDAVRWYNGKDTRYGSLFSQIGINSYDMARCQEFYIKVCYVSKTLKHCFEVFLLHHWQEMWIKNDYALSIDCRSF